MTQKQIEELEKQLIAVRISLAAMEVKMQAILAMVQQGLQEKMPMPPKKAAEENARPGLPITF